MLALPFAGKGAFTSLPRAEFSAPAGLWHFLLVHALQTIAYCKARVARRGVAPWALVKQLHGLFVKKIYSQTCLFV